MPTVSEAIHLIKASQGICEKACLRLHKIVSNKKEVLEAIPAEDHAKGIKERNLAIDPLPIERALGVMWCVESDSFRFRIELRHRPLTRRGVLSVVGSIYNPNGYLALSGPEFLWESGACNPERGKVSLLLEADPEVKKASVLTTEVKTVSSFPGHFESSRLDGVSSW